MAKRILLFLFSLCVLSSVWAQPFGFEWIQSGQAYYKVKIAKQGIYRIDAATLAAAGIDVEGTQPKRFQLFRDGQEQAIFIYGDKDGQFDPSDYIEFYADKNDGKLDTELYKSASDHAHTLYSLYTDTAYYFLTILPASSPKTGARLGVLSDTSYASYTPEPYFTYSQNIVLKDFYYRGGFIPSYPDPYYLSPYLEGESWVGSLINAGESREFIFNTPFATASGFSPSYECKVFGNSNANLNANLVNHHLRISIAADAGNYTNIKDSSFVGYGVNTFSNALSNSFIGNNSTRFRFDVINDLGVASDIQAVSYIKLQYARLFNLGNQSILRFRHNAIQSGLRSYLKFDFYAAGFQNPILYDLSVGQRIQATLKNGNEIHALLNNDGKPHEIYLCDSLDIMAIAALQPINFVSIDPNNNYEFLIVSNEKLATAANRYKQYRSSKYNTLLVNSNQLYDLYFYGYPHPLAVKRFCNHLLTKQLVKPSFLLLLGRGYQNSLTRLPNTNEYFANNLVPSIGEPASDNMFTAGLAGSTKEPAIATGRIAASSNEEAENYLDKLIYYETSSDSIQAWRKQILHLSGGSNAGQQAIFKSQLAAKGNTIRGKYFGANVSSYNKNSTLPTQSNLKQTLIDEINNGKSLVTFLGHGSLTILDLDFGSIRDLNNRNRYPFFYFNGCNIGNANDIDPGGTGQVYGKDYICAKDKGAIGWLAHSNFTFDGNLYTQMDAVYKKLCVDAYAKPIGQVLQEAFRSINSTDEYTSSHALQLILQGDPAVKIYSPILPDYAVANNDLFLSTGASAQSDSFALNVVITNLGKTTDDSIEVYLTQTLADGKKRELPVVNVLSPYYKDTIQMWIKGTDKALVGNNTFELWLDKNNRLVESQKQNNSAILNVFIPGTGLTNLLPSNYAIVNSDEVKLIAQNNNLFASNSEYIFEVDTSIQFNPASSFYQTSRIITAQSLATWQLNLNAKDSQVFFWRSRLNLPESQGGQWNMSSFTYLKNGGEGWRQSNFDQYKNWSSSELMMQNPITRQLEFANDEKQIGIYVRRWNTALNSFTSPYFLNAQVFKCLNEGVVATVFNKYKADESTELPNYPFQCQNIIDNKNGVNDLSLRYYTFNTNTPQGQSDLTAFIDSVGEGYYVGMFSRLNSNAANWSQELRDAFKKFGTIKIPAIGSNNTAWAMVGKKGANWGTAFEDTIYNDKSAIPDTALADQVRFTANIVGKWFTGNFTTAAIGPANAWQSLAFLMNNTDVIPSGRYWFDVIGISKNGQETNLASNVNTSNYNLSNIDANQYPYLKIRVNYVDSTFRTPHQFGFLQVNYSVASEAMLDPSLQYSFYNDNLAQGDSINIKILARNLSKTPYDSSLVDFSIADDSRLVKYKQQIKIKNLLAYDSILIEKKMPTYILSGLNTLTLKLNADEKVKEQSFINNSLSKTFTVQTDKINPYLEVTFDGTRIANEDIVSPSPTIRIVSIDNNVFKLQNDTSTFSLYLRTPQNFNYERINLNSADLKFIPATSTDNKAVLEYRPQKLSDGVYGLKVMSKDASGIASGANEYAIDYTVISKSSLSYFYPYPNPCTTNMRFVYTLTGDKIPDDLLIRITTITGKVVREVSKQEFGTMRIGNNISDFAWDGTDMYGDRLANGVYLYQVLSKINGADIERRLNAKVKDENKFFVENTGKIYLMR